MKQQVPPGIIAAVVVVVVLVIGLIAYNIFWEGNPGKTNASPEQLKQMQEAKMRAMTSQRDENGHPIPGTSTSSIPAKQGE